MLINFSDETPKDSILVIDDELPILNMLKLNLTRKGFKVDTAQSGEEGLKKIKSNGYKIILTDIKMPGMSGTQVLCRLNEQNLKSTRVIGMSGTPWLLNQNNFDAVLSKPCSLNELKTTIDRVIKN